MSVSEKESKMTDPEEVSTYVQRTGIDMLAVTIGNVHGQYVQPPQLDLHRLTAISKNLPANFPLILHGASGLSSELINEALKRGVCKFNVNTDMRIAAMDYVRDTIVNNKKVSGCIKNYDVYCFCVFCGSVCAFCCVCVGVI